MSDNSTTTIRATFETRASADLAVEHLVQQHGIARPDIFIQSSTDENTVGTVESGGDISHDDGTRTDAPLAGTIEVSADISTSRMADVRQSLEEAGASHVSGQ